MDGEIFAECLPNLTIGYHYAYF